MSSCTVCLVWKTPAFVVFRPTGRLCERLVWMEDALAAVTCVRAPGLATAMSPSVLPVLHSIASPRVPATILSARRGHAILVKPKMKPTRTQRRASEQQVSCCCCFVPYSACFAQSGWTRLACPCHVHCRQSTPSSTPQLSSLTRTFDDHRHRQLDSKPAAEKQVCTTPGPVDCKSRPLTAPTSGTLE